VSTNFFGNARVLNVSPLARLEFVACLVVAKRGESDGRVTFAQVRREQPDVDNHDLLLKELVEQGLLDQEDDKTFVIRGFLGWNRSKEELDEMRSMRAENGRAGGLASGESRRKQVASDVRSNLLEHGEASVEPNTTHHTTPEAQHTGAGSPAGQGEGENPDDGRGRVAARLAALCTAKSKMLLPLEAAEVVNWAAKALDMATIDEVVGEAAGWPKPPTLPRAVVKALQQRAERARVPLPDFLPLAGKGGNGVGR
jgi:hypothetical protein